MDDFIYNRLCAIRDCDWMDLLALTKATHFTVPDIDTLKDEGIINEANHKYRLSIKGRMLLSEYEQTRADIRFNKIVSIASAFIALASFFVSLIALALQFAVP